ncbi:MAG: ATP-NAD kinase family protein [Thermomicrobiales bacterium]|nr:ATP-NAD kinase family protein [Thermomicrobiales bacterium]
MKRIGLIVNPIAGMGGRVGLKGTDGPAALEQARALGATPLSGERARQALAVLRERLGDDLLLLAAPGPMGADIAESLGIATRVPPSPDRGRGAGGEGEDGKTARRQDGEKEGDLLPSPAVGRGAGGEGCTSSADTQTAVAAILAEGVDLLLFAGGDGTARDVYAAAGTGPPVLGIPTGVKMHSAVYATTPRAAGEAAAAFLTAAKPQLRESEVMDIDEEAFRQGRLSARLFGYLMVPYQRTLVQSLKSGSTSGEADLTGIATDIAERMRDGALWIIGPGTTTRAIAARLGVPKTLLGVDLYSRGELVASDATEQTILRHLDGVPAHIVVTPIGGQGYLFGRGNQQFSPEVIRRVDKSNIVVVSTLAKLTGLAGAPLLVDTGDPTLDAELAGYMRVVTGFRQESVQRVL